MNDTKQMLQRARDQFEPPQDFMGLLVRRRDRKLRNKQISAGVVALVVAVAGIGAVLRAFDASPRTPAALAPSPLPLASNGDLTFVARDSSDFASLYLVDPDGGNPRKILDAGCSGNPDDPPSCEDVGIRSVDWSPDGSRIVYTLWGTTPAGIGVLEGIYVMEIATEQVHQLTSCTAPCFLQTDVEWSPDGSRIAYTQVDVAGCDAAWAFSGSCSIYTMDADGTDRVMLSTGSVVDPVNPSWSPNGREIAFSARGARSGSSTRWPLTARSRPASPPISPRPSRTSRPGRRTVRRSPSWRAATCPTPLQGATATSISGRSHPTDRSAGS